MTIVTIGIDLAKTVFAVHGVDATGKAALVRPSVPHAKLMDLIALLPPCLIGMHACLCADHRLLPPPREACVDEQGLDLRGE